MQYSTARKEAEVILHETDIPTQTMTEEVHAGLVQEQKTLSPKFFYDKRGSDLFDAITELPEYYPTRTETALLRKHKNELAQLFGEDSSLYELGSGSSTKIRLLLEAVRPKVYIPMDISRDHLVESAGRLLRDYPWLDIRAVHVDYSRPWDVPDFGPGHYNAFFPGSSIGNFEPDAALALLRRIKLLVAKGGGLVIGVDLKKDVAILEAAYNDERGVTAEFNLNILRHINRNLDADFDLANFAHRAFYHTEKGRIEMHLESLQKQQVRINGNVYSFNEGETIQTESSYKYTAEEFHQLAKKAGFLPAKTWIDSNAMFSLHYLVGE